MNKREMKKELAGMVGEMETMPAMYGGEEPYRSVYLGSYMSLDPCGRYHHILSPNGATARCAAYWERLEEAAGELGGWIDSGEGDPTDIFFCLPVEEEEEDSE